MNQNRIKWVFVVLFLVMNLYLGRQLWQSHWHKTSISEDTAAHVVSVLKQHDVSIKDELIPRSNQKMREFSVKNTTEPSSEFMRQLPSKGWKKQDSGNFAMNGVTLSFEGERVTYSGQIGMEKGLSGKALAGAVKEVLEQLGIRLQNVKLKTIEQTGTGARLEYVQTYDDYEMFGTGLTVTVEKDAITSVSGVWLETMNDKAKRMSTMFSTDALVQFAQDRNRPANARITEVVSGYYASEMGEQTGHKVMQMLPVYQITTASGEKFYYDARSPLQ